LFDLIGTLENTGGESNLYGIVDAQIALVEGEFVHTTS
jgi:hypothetical protein